MMRPILGVILGYAIFVISSILLFRISEVNPHADASNYLWFGHLFMELYFHS